MYTKTTAHKPYSTAKAADHTTRSATPQIMLRCPCCKRTQSADLDKTDPPNTAIVEYACDQCDQRDDSEVNYFNAAGQRIDCDKGLPL